MRSGALFLVLGVVLAAPCASAQAGARLLVLDLQRRGDVSSQEEAAARALVTDALRARVGLLVATSQDVRRRAPLQADRAAACAEELCLHELADALDADFVLFGEVSDGAEGRAVRLGLFEAKSGQIIDREQVDGSDIATIAPFISAAMDRLLEPVLAEATPGFFERPLFLVGTGTAAVGALVAAGAGGWALELELSLGEAERHRDVKRRALEQGPVLLAAAATGTAVALLGAGLLITSLALEP